MSQDLDDQCSCSDGYSDQYSNASEYSNESVLSNITIDWNDINPDKFGNLFFLEHLNEACRILESVVLEEKDADQKERTFSKVQRLRNNYSKFADWVLGKKDIKSNTIKKYTKKDSNVSTPSPESLDLFNYIHGQKINQQSYLFTLMYLTSPSDNSSNAKDPALFIYPKVSEDEDEPNLKIIKLKGMFLSLVQIINDVTGQLPVISKLNVYKKNITQEFNDQLFNISYVQEFNSTLVLCLPQEKFEESQSIELVNSISRVIKFLYNSMDAAFKNIENHENLFLLMDIFHCILKQEISNFDMCYHFDLAQKIILEDDLILCIDEALSRFEAMDWISSECSSENSSELMIIGTALFYKGYLITSHLSPHYLSDIISFLKFRGLLTLNQKFSVKLIFWQEVYPCSKSYSLTDFNENEGTRYFLLVVGVHKSLFCVLLEMPFISADPNISPPILIINQSLRFVSGNLNRSGLIQEIDHHITIQKEIYSRNSNEKEEDKSVLTSECSSNSSRIQSESEWVDFYSDERFRLPSNLVLYLDIDFRSRVFYSPLVEMKSYRDVVLNVISDLRKYNGITEIGRKWKGKKRDLWVIGRKECEREIYLFYKCEKDVICKDLFHRLSSQNRC